MNRKLRTHLLARTLVGALAVVAAAAADFGTAFVYQGRLNDQGQPANGLYDLRFVLYTDATGGTALGEVEANPTGVTNGLFTVRLDFGADGFDGQPRWLEVLARANGAAGDHELLAPRQEVLPAPYALVAAQAAVAGVATVATSAQTATTVAPGAVSAAGIAPSQVVKSLNNLRDNLTLAAGDNLTLTPSGQTLTLSSPTDWHLGGNSGTTPGTHFLGTLDNQALELKVNGLRALRLEPNSSGAPNVIGGSQANAVAGGVLGATIAGGGATNYGGSPYPNRADADFATVGGGRLNTIEGGATLGTVSGGQGNLIQSNVVHGTIGGGQNNQLQGVYGQTTQHGFIGGGRTNVLEASTRGSSIVGGEENRIQSEAYRAFIGAGYRNVIGTNASYSVIAGGYGNIISNSAGEATIPGGYGNVAGQSYTFAAGRQAKANHQGSFVWGDSQAADFASTANNQFLIRASGGVGLGTNSPQAALHVAGTVRADAFVSGGNTPASFGSVGIGTATPEDALLDVEGDMRLNDHDLFLRGGADRNHGLGWYGNWPYEKPFGGQTPDGPVLYGFGGGGLGTTEGGANLALGWNRSGAVAVDPQHRNTGGLTPGLIFGVGSGEGISSKRTPEGNAWGLDFYTYFEPRLSITQSGNVGIGTTSPSAKLEVAGTVKATAFEGPGLMTWQTANGSSITAAPNRGYIAQGPTLLTLLLPASPPVGTTINVLGAGTGGWRVNANVGQSFNLLGGGGGGGGAGSWVARDSDRAWRAVASSADGTKLVAAAMTGLYTSADSGISWTPPETSRAWTAVASSADGTKLVAGAFQHSGNADYHIYTSGDSGATWVQRTQQTVGHWIQIASSVDGNGLVAVSSGQDFRHPLLTSADAGINWHTDVPHLSAPMFYAVASAAVGIP